MRTSTIYTAAVALAVTAAAVSCNTGTGHTSDRESLSTPWATDILGDGYESRHIDMGDSYDGPVRTTVIRRLTPCGDSLRRAILYVHGFNDYFFQSELGRRLNDSCYNFYAVDLRRYGRSLMPGQRPFDLRDDHEYFADIDSALSVIRHDGATDVTLVGHSTGGLTTALYMTEQPDTLIKRLVLNSPFLDWNLSYGLERYAIPAVSWIGRCIHGINISQSGSETYAHSLLSDYNGEWEYSTDWKMTKSPDVTSGWISAINRAQHQLRDRHIDRPVLLMHSDRSSTGVDSLVSKTDVVLDVDDIHRYGTRLGDNVTEVTIPGGIHDLILSSPAARDSTYRAIFRFLPSRTPARSDKSDGLD